MVLSLIFSFVIVPLCFKNEGPLLHVEYSVKR
jgi:hypothetical protein